MVENEIGIRGAVRSDLPALLAIERACFGEDALPAISLVQYLELFPSTFLVAERSGECVGLAIGGASAEDPAMAWLLDIAVAPVARGRGIARRLLDEIRRVFQQRGVRGILATVDPDNHASAALLRNAGFVLLRHEGAYFGANAPRHVLVLHL